MDDLLTRVHEQARTVRPFRALLTLLALPFYAIGLLLGLVVVVVLYAWAAMKTGVADVRAKAPKAPAAATAAAGDA